MSDDALMERIQSGEFDPSLKELRRRFRARVLHLGQSILHDRHLAEDVCEEVFEKVFLKSHLYTTGTHFAAWLLEVTRNQALSTLRSRRCLPRTAGSFIAGHDDDDGWYESARGTYEERTVEENELMERFEAAVAELPDSYRIPFQLCVRDGLQYREAADALDIPTGTVAIRIMRARKRLFQALGRHIGPLRRPPACFSAA